MFVPLNNPILIFLRSGDKGFCVALAVVVLFVVAVNILIKKPEHGDLLVYGLVRGQFFLGLLWMCLSMCWAAGHITSGNLLRIFWLRIQVNMIIGAICLFIMPVVGLLAAMHRYRTAPEITMGDVAGMSAGMFSVALLIVTGNILMLAIK